MNEDTDKKKRRFAWIVRIGSLALIVILLYYAIVEHTTHFIRYAEIFAVFLLILGLVIVEYGMLRKR